MKNQYKMLLISTVSLIFLNANPAWTNVPTLRNQPITRTQIAFPQPSIIEILAQNSQRNRLCTPKNPFFPLSASDTSCNENETNKRATPDSSFINNDSNGSGGGDGGNNGGGDNGGGNNGGGNNGGGNNGGGNNGGGNNGGGNNGGGNNGGGNNGGGNNGGGNNGGGNNG
ncbi:MAG: hypothetical protein K1X44_03930, partial [Alphaproteobacteria bacterium]|nr:hypothetical protein [Alphaproteobacteria bacterium]